MGKRRKRNNHGVRSMAGDLAWNLVSHRVPDAQIRLEQLRARWQDIATVGVAAKAWPSELIHGELVVNVHDNQWLHELTYLQPDLLRRIRELCPNTRVESVRVRLGYVRGAETPGGAAPEPQREPLPAEPSPDTMSALEDVGDAELRAAIAGARVALSRR